MDGAWEDEVQQAVLADVAESLERRRVNNSRLQRSNPNIAVNGVSDDPRANASHQCLPEPAAGYSFPGQNAASSARGNTTTIRIIRA